MDQQIKFYQTGTFTVGNRLLSPGLRTVQASIERSNSLNSGHRACQGCGEALGARYAIDAAMRATSRRLIAANATGCLEVFSTPYPEIVVAAAVDPLAVRQRRRGRHRHRRGAQGEGAKERQGAERRARHRAGRRRRHDRHRLRLPVGDVRAQRRRALHLLRQRGLHEHRRPAQLGARRRPRARRRRWRWGAPRRRVWQGQERAADRDGARDPVRRDRDGRRPARSRGEGRARDGDARRALPAHPRALPARLGLGQPRHDQARAAGARDRHLPGVRGRARRGHSRHEDPPPRAGRRVPAAAEALRPPVRRQGACRDAGAHPGRRRQEYPALPSARRREADEHGKAVRDHARPGLVARQQDRLVAHRAAGLRRPAAAVQRRSAPRARTSRAGSSTPRAATTKPPGAT